MPLKIYGLKKKMDPIILVALITPRESWHHILTWGLMHNLLKKDGAVWS
jgi:hypothetical protein